MTHQLQFMRLFTGSRRLFVAGALSAALVGGASLANGQSTVVEEHLYVGIGQFWTMHHMGEQSAYMFREDGGQLVALPDNPDPDRLTSEFRIMDLLSGVSENDNTWFIGVPDIRVMRRVNGALIDMSDHWEYGETIHHMVLKMVPVVTTRDAADPCGNRIWPIGTGSEMTPYRLDFAGRGNQYAMHWKGGDKMGGIAWHWANPGGIGQEEELFIRFTLRFDLDPNPEAYKNVNVSWISAGGGCDYDFCLISGYEERVGSAVTLPPDVRRARLVAAFPHIHDHALQMKLIKRSNGRNTELLSTTINNDRNYSAAHHCAPDGEMIAAHTHSGNETGHLPWRALAQQVWYNADVTINQRDRLFTAAAFDVPVHGAEDLSVDEMAFYVVFWENLD